MLPERGDLAGQLEDAGIEVVVQPLAVLRRRLLSPRGLVELADVRRRERAALAALARDVAVVHSNTSVILGGQAAAERAAIPHVVHVREIYAGALGSVTARAWPLLRRRLMAAAARICVSRAVAAQFDPARTYVVYDGAVPRATDGDARDSAARADARADLGIPADAFVVALLGRIADWKGQYVLARALAEPALADIGAVGLIAGAAYPGEEARAPSLERLRDDLGLGDRLRLLGFVGDPAPVLSAADVVVVPSTRPDPFPNSALEALATGVPVVASNAGGLSEMVRDGETGVLVPASDHVALANALRALADDPDRRGRMGHAAVRDVQERFSYEAMLDAVEAVYADVGVRR